jgi:hypothetical protein
LLNDDTRFGHGAEQPSVQTGGAKYRVETFAIGVLPGTARLNVMRAHMLGF